MGSPSEGTTHLGNELLRTNSHMSAGAQSLTHASTYSYSSVAEEEHLGQRIPERQQGSDASLLANELGGTSSKSVAPPSKPEDRSVTPFELRETNPSIDALNQELRQGSNDSRSMPSSGDKGPDSTSNIPENQRDVLPFTNDAAVVALQKSVQKEKARADAAEKHLYESNVRLEEWKRQLADAEATWKDEEEDTESMGAIGRLEATMKGLRTKMECFGPSPVSKAFNPLESHRDASDLRSAIVEKSRENIELRDSLKIAEEQIMKLTEANREKSSTIAKLRKTTKQLQGKPEGNLSTTKEGVEDVLNDSGVEVRKQDFGPKLKAAMNDIREKEKEISVLKKVLEDMQVELKAREESLLDAEDKLQQTNKKVTYFSFQAAEYKGRLESWLTDANEQRTKVQHDLQITKAKLKEKDEAVVMLRKSLIESLALLKPLRHQVAFSEQDIRGLKRRVGSSQLVIFSLQEALLRAGESHDEPSISSSTNEHERELASLKDNAVAKDKQLEALRQSLHVITERLKDTEALLEEKSDELHNKVGDENDSPTNHLAADIESLRRDLVSTQNEKVAIEEELQRTLGDMKSIQKQVDTMDHDRTKLKEELASTQKMLSALERGLNSASVTIDEIELLQEKENLAKSMERLAMEKQAMAEEWKSIEAAASLPIASRAHPTSARSLRKHIVSPCVDNNSDDATLQKNDGVDEELKKLRQEKEELRGVVANLELDHKRLIAERNRDLRNMLEEKDGLSRSIKDMEAELQRLKMERRRLRPTPGSSLPSSDAPDKKIASETIESFEEKLSDLENRYQLTKKQLSSEKLAKTSVEEKFKQLLQEKSELSKAVNDLEKELKRTKEELLPASGMTKPNEENVKDKIKILEERSNAPTSNALKPVQGGLEYKLQALGIKLDSPDARESSFEHRLKKLEGRLFEMACLYQVTKKKLQVEKAANASAEEDLRGMAQDAEDTAGQIDELRKTLLRKENELAQAKRIATKAFVKVDELTREKQSVPS